MKNSPIGLFDSGIGGITVLDSCRKLLPHENFVYISDFSHSPYGNRPQEYILNRVDACVNELASHGVKAIVAACNTATNVGIEYARKQSERIFLGVEPALKPARKECGDGQVLLLCTHATTNQSKFKQLLLSYGGDNVVVLPQSDLATLIENNIENLSVLQGVVNNIFSPYPNACGVVLGCTHYVYLKELIYSHYSSNIKIFDGNDGVARHLKTRLEEKNLLCDNPKNGAVKFITL